MKRGDVWWVNFEPAVGGEVRRKPRGCALVPADLEGYPVGATVTVWLYDP